MKSELSFKKNKFDIAIGYEPMDEGLQAEGILNIFKPFGGIDGIIDALNIGKIDPETGFDILKTKVRREIRLYFELFKNLVWDVECSNFYYSTERNIDTYFRSKDRSSSEIIKQIFACRLFLLLMEVSSRGQLYQNHLRSYLSVAGQINARMSELRFHYMEQEKVSLEDLEFPIKELYEDNAYWVFCNRVQLVEELELAGVLTVRDLISLTEKKLKSKLKKRKSISRRDGFHELRYNLNRMGLGLKVE